MTIEPERDPTRVVLDTNVAVALLVFDDPALRSLNDAWGRGDFVAVVDDETLSELIRVLRYPEMRLAEPDAVAIEARYRAVAMAIDRPPSASQRHLPACRDPDDQKFLALAQRAGADWLLTRDKALLRLKGQVSFAIATPEDFTPSRAPIPARPRRDAAPE